MTNSRLIPSLALLVGTLFIWATALAAKHEPAAGKDEPVGTVEIEEKEFRLILGGQKGSGVLHIQGNKYPFKVGGITVGGVGFTELSATAKVYDLEDVSQFPGNFVQYTDGITVGKGMGGLAVQNENGVRLNLKTSSEGLALSIGAGGLKVTMEE
jgi:hypothetical protein